ncbi:tRNA (adenosine(37)-N6)-dimethylallyltransferase MiaA [Plastoroseomonas arctica]|uniref:tRNA dimethylallyltransferase n=1 Tax=Plastoroseomonas arctica TaxID=1509237 RepID=A0AAF1K3U9_9PROT|nr:tRNA (adenosine(37)-N6)-dimethylallyltransferase MiaA [Plastoroseomonas arctica]MBR0655734.1 tRNA (adenosine(37)-N6)-dimethylallyltransferase MiaA [Plastoroseomonas arctica]
MTDQPWALIVAGPTASGKSALAIEIAQRVGGTVINADSMQVYGDLRVLTARPTPEEEALVPHALYGVRDAAEAASVAWWRAAALEAMAAARAAGRVPILCGGTGLYLRALRAGIAPMPAIPDEVRSAARDLLANEGPAAMHARLAARDPDSAATLRPSDSQRIARAWEVLVATGQGIAAWQAMACDAPAPWRFAAVLLDPPRTTLRDAIAGRWGTMLATGAIDEVRQLVARGLDPALPAMRAHGVPELAAHFAGTMTIEAASARAILNTGQYTKRQATWFRHQELADPAATHRINARYAGLAQFSESDRAQFFAFLQSFVDAPWSGV